MKNLVIAILAGMLLGTCAKAQAANVDVTNIATKIVKGPDSVGDVWYSIKCTVKNNENHDVATIVLLQALDQDDFELTSVPVSLKLKAHESKSVTDQSYMPFKDFRRAKWQVKD